MQPPVKFGKKNYELGVKYQILSRILYFQIIFFSTKKKYNIHQNENTLVIDNQNY